MKTALALTWFLSTLPAVLTAVERVHHLKVEVLPRFAGALLVFDAVTNVTAQGQQLSITRLDFLLSKIAFRSGDGAWIGLTNWATFMSPREGRTSFELNSLPAGQYDRIRFHIGVQPGLNHSNPAQHPPGHPLNPMVNGLHWDWQGGYVYFALEGSWKTSDRQFSGYSYHIATDRHLMTVELPIALDLTDDRELTLALDIDKVFVGPNIIELNEAVSSTHSGEGDELANQLRKNIECAFSVTTAPSRRRSTVPLTHQSTNPSLLMASNATPYPFTFSRFFPMPELPTDNPLTDEGVRLGALLFFDPRLSANRSQSCGACHQADSAFADRGRAVSRGANGHPGTRNAMPLFNLAWKSSFFWDGRTPSLREQVLQPIQNPIEMHETLENAVAKVKSSRVNLRHQARASASLIQPSQFGALKSHRRPLDQPVLNLATLRSNDWGIHRFEDSTFSQPDDYPSLFAEAFGTRQVSADRIARALEQFLLTQVSHDSKFDRFLAGKAKLTASEHRGLELFRTEYDPRRKQFGADCFHCHGGPLFRSLPFANNGLDSDFKDPGRFLVTKKDGDKGKFAVPSLRNVAVTAPYMHDGRFGTLEEVIEHYSTGVKPSATLDPNLAKHPRAGLALSAVDKNALVTFLKTLTDERFLADE